MQSTLATKAFMFSCILNDRRTLPNTSSAIRDECERKLAVGWCSMLKQRKASPWRRQTLCYLFTVVIIYLSTWLIDQILFFTSLLTQHCNLFGHVTLQFLADLLPVSFVQSESDNTVTVPEFGVFDLCTCHRLSPGVGPRANQGDCKMVGAKLRIFPRGGGI